MSFTKDEVIAALAKMGKKVSDISSMEISQKGASGRATMFKINGKEEVSAPPFRVAIDSTKLKSLLLVGVEVAEDQVTFSDKGYGHGVGMSQLGVNKMATDGKKPEEIITHYFKGVTVEKRWQ